MAKLTLFFKGKILQVYRFDSGEVAIGRNPDCSIPIDSLAVAPVHAIIRITKTGDWLEQISAAAPLFVNDKKTDKHMLKDGDGITVGKHEVFYVEDEKTIGPVKEDRRSSLNGAIPPLIPQKEAPPAFLQFLNGKNMGLVIPLKSGMTRLGEPGTSSAAIAKRKDGYYLSSLDSEPTTRINQALVDNQTFKLKPGDEIEILSGRMQFFLQE